MKGLRLYKDEKLCGQLAIDRLFEQGTGLIAFPLRAVFLFRPEAAAPARILITIPKKKIRHAIARVRLRRQTREAFRLLRYRQLYPALQQAHRSVDIAFVWLDTTLADYSIISQRMETLLERIGRQAAGTQDTQQ